MIYNKHTTHIIILQEREALYYYFTYYCTYVWELYICHTMLHKLSL